MPDDGLRPPLAGRIVLLSGVALVGFAANSLLCRLALRGGTIDAGSFLMLRLVSGAAILALLAGRRLRADQRWAGDWLSAGALMAYAVAFTFAYLRLGAGVGALILFAAVQATMIGWGMARGERPGAVRWLGLALAFAGLAILVLPGASAPPPLPALGMAGAGAAWGIYSLRGRGVTDALATTAGNFLRGVPLAVAVWLACWPDQRWSTTGIRCALASGALASGLGYACWYAAVGAMSRTTAAIIQLSVPILAAAGGVAFLGETVSARLLGAAAAVIVGVAIATFARNKFKPDA